nr:capsid protein [Cressdnaviricota sp.]
MPVMRKKTYANKKRYTRVTKRYPRTYRKPRTEFKALDIQSQSIAVNTTGAVTPIVGIAGGADINQRIGNQVANRSYDFKGYIEADASATANQVCRIMFIWDTDPAGAAATLSQIFGTPTPTVNTERNLAYRNRFIIMKDMRVPLAPVGQDGSIRSVKWYRKMYKTTTYINNLGTIAAISKGVMLLVTFGSVVSGSADAQLRYDIRQRYTDN